MLELKYVDFKSVRQKISIQNHSGCFKMVKGAKIFRIPAERFYYDTVMCKGYCENEFDADKNELLGKSRINLQIGKLPKVSTKKYKKYFISKYLSNFCLTMRAQKITLGQVFVYRFCNR